MIFPKIKVMILAAGGASRMQPLSTFVAKPMVPIGNVPLLGRIIESFSQAGFVEFIIIYGVHEDQVMGYIHTYTKSHPKLKITLIKQPKPMGMADAVEDGEKSVYPDEESKNYPFVLTAGDILFESEKIKELVKIHLSTKSSMTLALAHSTDPKMAIGYGNVKMEKNRVIQIVEKPGEANRIGDYYSEPMYVFNYSLFPRLPLVKPSKRGEKELQDAMQMIIDSKEPISGYNIIANSIYIPIDGQYHVTYPRDFLAMNARLLPTFSQLKASLKLKITSPVSGSPQSIGDNSNLGPNVYFGNESKIGKNCQLINCYVFPKAEIQDDSILENCIIGEGFVVQAKSQLKNKICLANGIADLK
jgi:glucose-1-phosphate thymidylyltransferase